MALGFSCYSVFKSTSNLEKELEESRAQQKELEKKLSENIHHVLKKHSEDLNQAVKARMNNEKRKHYRALMAVEPFASQQKLREKFKQLEAEVEAFERDMNKRH